MLDSLFNLGFNRLFSRQDALIILCFSFPLLAFSDFGSNDSANLESIWLKLRDSIDPNLYQIGYAVSYAYFHDGDRYGFDVRDKYVLDALDDLYDLVDSIDSTLSSVNSKLATTTVSHYGQNDSYKSLNVHDVRTDDIYSRIGMLEDALLQGITNLQGSISGLGDVFTDELSNLSLTGGAINTNFPALFAYVPDTGFSLQQVFFLLYGRYPTSSQLTHFQSLVEEYGIANWFYLDKLISVDYFSLPSDLQQEIYHLEDYPWPFYEEIFDALAEAHYYQYGTRDLTDISGGISNDVAQILAILNNAFPDSSNVSSSQRELNSQLSQSVVYEGGSASYNNNVINMVGDLATDCIETLPSISTNVVTANTNAIVNLQDDNYNTELLAFTNSNPTDNPIDFNDVLTQVNDDTFVTDLTGFLSESPEPCVFTFDLSGFNLASQSRSRSVPSLGAVNITVSDVRLITDSYVSFFCAFAECIICLYFVALLWDTIYSSGSSFWTS